MQFCQTSLKALKALVFEVFESRRVKRIDSFSGLSPIRVKTTGAMLMEMVANTRWLSAPSLVELLIRLLLLQAPPLPPGLLLRSLRWEPLSLQGLRKSVTVETKEAFTLVRSTDRQEAPNAPVVKLQGAGSSRFSGE